MDIDKKGEREKQECLYMAGEIKKRLEEREPESHVIERANTFLARLNDGDTSALADISAIRPDLESLIEKGPEKRSDVAAQYTDWDLEFDIEEYYYILYGVEFERNEEYFRNHPPTYQETETPKEKSPREKLSTQIGELRKLEAQIETQKIENASVEENYNKFNELNQTGQKLMTDIRETLDQKPKGFFIKKDNRLETIDNLITEFKKNNINTNETIEVPKIEITKIELDPNMSDEELTKKIDETNKLLEKKQRELSGIKAQEETNKKFMLEKFKEAILLRTKLIEKISQTISDNNIDKSQKIKKIKSFLQQPLQPNF